MKRILKEIGSLVTLPLCLIFTYFIWYLWIISNFPLPTEVSIKIWPNAICMSIFVGTVLNANAYIPPLKQHFYLRKWSVFRFYVIPLCVSSYSSIAQHHSFVLLFPASEYKIGLIGMGIALGVFIFLNLLRIFSSYNDIIENKQEFQKVDLYTQTTPFQADANPL